MTGHEQTRNIFTYESSQNMHVKQLVRAAARNGASGSSPPGQAHSPPSSIGWLPGLPRLRLLQRNRSS
jgi:hypothetical protein